MPVAIHEASNEITLVNVIIPAFQGVSTGREVQRWADHANAAQSLRKRIAEFASHLEYKIAAHRIADEENLFEPVNVG